MQGEKTDTVTTIKATPSSTVINTISSTTLQNPITSSALIPTLQLELKQNEGTFRHSYITTSIDRTYFLLDLMKVMNHRISYLLQKNSELLSAGCSYSQNRILYGIFVFMIGILGYLLYFGKATSRKLHSFFTSHKADSHIV
jgi:hypothetical protein